MKYKHRLQTDVVLVFLFCICHVQKKNYNDILI